jgi:hypothetical protein
MSKETFVYDDADGSFEIEVDEGSITWMYITNGDLNTVTIEHHPHDLESFIEFLLMAGRECQAEFGRQEIERQNLLLQYPGRL